MSALVGDRRIDARCIALQQMKLICRKSGQRTVGGSANLQGALGTVVFKQRLTKDLRQIAGGVSAQCIHLPQPVLSGHISLRRHQIVERTCPKMRNTVPVALNRDRSGQPGDRDRSVQLWQSIVHGLASPMTRIEEANHAEKHDKQRKNNEESIEDPSAFIPQSGAGFFRGGCCGNRFVRVHSLDRSVNGVWESARNSTSPCACHLICFTKHQF